MAAGDNPIEKLATFAELHDEVDGNSVLVSVFEGDDVGMVGEVPHDVYLPPHIFDIHRRLQLLLGYGLAGEFLPRLLVDAQVGYPKLTPAELAAELVPDADVPTRGLLEDAKLGDAGAIVGGVVDGKRVGLGGLLLPLLHAIRVGTAVTHESQPKIEKKAKNKEVKGRR